MTVESQVEFYEDNFASQIRIGMLIRRNTHKNVSFETNYEDPSKIKVVTYPSQIIIHFSSASLFEYSSHTAPLTTLEEVEEIEENNPNEAFTPEELLELGLYAPL